MELRDYLRAARKRWWLTVIALGLALGLAGLVTAYTVPQYATTITFFVTTPNHDVGDSYTGGLFSQQRVKSYTDLLRSDRLAKAVVALHTVDLTADQVRGRITAQAQPDTVLLDATVTDGNRDRSLQIAQALSGQFIKLVQTLETSPGSTTPSVKVEVVNGPRLDPTPVSPRPVRNLAVAGLLGLMIGLGAAVLVEMLDTSVNSIDLLSQLTSAPVLGTIPFDAAAKKTPLIVAGSARSARAEAFRHLRTNLQFVDVDRPVRSIVITSAVPNEGKSTTAANLSIALAEAGTSVLLIDADLRRPWIAEYLGLEGAVGLTNVLAGKVSIEDALQQWGNTSLWVLPSGVLPPNPSELLGSHNMADLLDAMRDGFGCVIIDTPPLLPVTDGAVTAVRVDGAVLVARHGRTPRSQVSTAVRALSAVDARLLGCVFNMVPSKGSGSYYSYQYGARGVAKPDRVLDAHQSVPRMPADSERTEAGPSDPESERSGANADLTRASR